MGCRGDRHWYCQLRLLGGWLDEWSRSRSGFGWLCPFRYMSVVKLRLRQPTSASRTAAGPSVTSPAGHHFTYRQPSRKRLVPCPEGHIKLERWWTLVLLSGPEAACLPRLCALISTAPKVTETPFAANWARYLALREKVGAWQACEVFWWRPLGPTFPSGPR